MKIQSSSNSHFAVAPQADIPRSSFNRSHGLKTTFNAGLLIPIFVDEVLPGDTFNLRMHAFCRLATPLFPLMDNMYLETFFFFVPNRLVWDNWEKFCGAQTNPGDSTSYVYPTINFTTAIVEQSLFDYMGLPINIANVGNIQTLPFRSYNLIWNEWFRDTNMQNSLTVRTTDGGDLVTDYVIKNRGKRHDYFTSCLPWPQKGPAVTLPLGTSAQVKSDGNPPFFHVGASNYTIQTNLTQSTVNLNAPGASTGTLLFGSAANTAQTGLFADLTTATAATINQLRQAFQIQRMYERDARGGTRYVELLLAHFKVTAPDFRLQRPELLSTHSSPLILTPVAQTSATGQTGSTTPQGKLSAFGTVAMLGHGFVKSFVEHGHIIGLVCARADLTYWQGINRLWLRTDRFSIYWPALSHLGEQAVLNKELYVQGTAADAQVFGYQECFAEYRYKPAQITSLFRPSATGSLDAWHLAQDFGSLPTLNSTFISENPPMARIKATATDPDFIMDAHFTLKCARPMPVYSVPGLIDHF